MASWAQQKALAFLLGIRRDAAASEHFINRSLGWRGSFTHSEHLQLSKKTRVESTKTSGGSQILVAPTLGD